MEIEISVIAMAELGNRANKVCCKKNSKCRRREERPKRKMMYVDVILTFSCIKLVFLSF
jgi:hypothetical protein